MKKSLPLYSKLALILTSLGIFIAVAFISLALWSSDRYHQEVTQQLHKGLAQYVLEHLPGPMFQKSIDASIPLRVDNSVLKTIAVNTMMINPSVEVFLLDPDGKLLGHALPERSVKANDISIQPVHQFLDQQNQGPVLGQNPRKPDQSTIFSAAPVFVDDEMKGYLYVVLASNEALSTASQLSGSHIVRLTVGGIAALAVFFGLASLLSFRRVTKPLQKLSQEVRAYRQSNLADATPNEAHPKDEVAELALSFDLMQQRIQQQFDQLSETDRIRRELISNVSHDLRTPLAAMQGYLETLLLKSKDLDPEKQQQYIHIAHRHSKQLNDLISQLFELSKLDAGKIEPELEAFSLSELLYDVKQDYELPAEQRGISLDVNVPEENAIVTADISLIQRVLQNLIDNAMRHTPSGGNINLMLDIRGDQVMIHVADSGKGIEKEDLPFVFERFYQSEQAPNQKNATAKIGAGLGLSIVKKILDLHNTIINVESEPQRGTRFCFALPRLA